jgi:hypothetical protein
MKESLMHKKAMTVRFKISRWIPRRYDKTVSQEVKNIYEMKGEGGRYNKILTENKKIEEIGKYVAKMYARHYELTLPYLDGGLRLISCKGYPSYIEEMQKMKDELLTMVEQIDYDSIIEEAKIALGKRFDPADYPMNKEDMMLRYKVDVKFLPLPEVSDVNRIEGIVDEETKRIEIQVRESIHETQVTVMKELWNRLYDVIKHIVDRLDESDKIFRDSLIGNVASLCELLPNLNIMEDEDLEKMRREIEQRLLVDPKLLRENDDIRKQTYESAKDILSAMQGFIK